MTIIERDCSFCTKHFRENGDYKFEDAVESHFKEEHPEEWSKLDRLKKEANKEFEELEEKYPEVILRYGSFGINIYKLLKSKEENEL